MVDEKVPDSIAESSPAVVETPVVEDEFALPEEVKDEKSRARVQKIIDEAKTAREQLAAWKAFGSPDEVQNYVQYAHGLEAQLEAASTRLKALEEKRETGEPKTEQQKALESQAEMLRRAIREADPVLTKMEKYLEQQDARDKARIQALTMDAVDDTAKVMKEHGMSVTDAKVRDMCDLLEPIIRKNPRLAFRFERNPEAAIRSAMDLYLDNAREAIDGKSKLEAQRAKEKMVGLPRAHGGGGGPGPSKTTEPPRTVADGVARALGKLGEGRR
jgi:hypothetical protein